MNIHDYHRTQADAGCEWMTLIERSNRAAAALHYLLAGIGLGMVLFGALIHTLPRMIP